MTAITEYRDDAAWDGTRHAARDGMRDATRNEPPGSPRGGTHSPARGEVLGETRGARRGGSGVPLTVKLRVVSGNSGRARADCAVSLWHCGGHRNRSRQVAGADGWVTFGSAFPGMDAGRWPHVHFAVHAGDDDDCLLHAAQLVLPGDACARAFRRARLDGMSIAGDECFTGGWALEIPSVTGDASRGLVATRTVCLS